MELDQILQLIDKVSDSSLTAFDYEADGIKIAMEHGKAAPVQVQMSGVPSGAVEGQLFKYGTYFECGACDGGGCGSSGIWIPVGEQHVCAEMPGVPHYVDWAIS